MSVRAQTWTPLRPRPSSVVVPIYLYDARRRESARIYARIYNICIHVSGYLPSQRKHQEKHAQRYKIRRVYFKEKKRKKNEKKEKREREKKRKARARRERRLDCVSRTGQKPAKLKAVRSTCARELRKREDQICERGIGRSYQTRWDI